MDSAAAARIPCFKAYDVRGRVPAELDPGLAARIGAAYAAWLRPRRVAIGYDVRPSSPALAQALTAALVDAGCEVVDIGRCGTEEVYFATFHLGLSGGIMVTASHNPPEYNGFKIVREEGRPVSADSGLKDIERLARSLGWPSSGRAAPATAPRPGAVVARDTRAAYVAHLLSYVDAAALPRLDVVVNAGNGMAGPVVDALEPHLPARLIKVHNAPDGAFPNGVPNPILPENRAATADVVRSTGADLGVAWDGDFDRCFFFDARGRFVEGCYLVGLLAERALARHPGAAIVHDPRLVYNVIDVVERAGGRPVPSKGGHAFMKETLRREDAVYGGENPGHHFFREFSSCDSGMIPFLLVLEHLGRTGTSLAALLDERAALYPVSGELNFQIDDPAAATARVRDRFEAEAQRVDELDGVSMDFGSWRFNVRRSNTEPLVRLNVEARADAALVAARTAEIRRLLLG